MFNEEQELAPVNNYFISDMGIIYLLTGRARFSFNSSYLSISTLQMFLLNSSYYYQKLTNTEAAGHRCSRVVQSWT